MSKKPIILGMESSCDETAAAIIEDNDNNGVKIIDINSDGEAYNNNIRKNDIINEINRVEIKNSNDYYKEIANYSKGNVIMLRIVRNGNNLYEAFEIK